MRRLLRHLCSGQLHVRRTFSSDAMQNIEAAIRAAETAHHGEIRFAVEAGLDILPLLKNQSARERSLEVFAHLRAWDTELNNGVLIYLLLADHDVEIIADRGVNEKVGHEGWEKICRDMETLFRAGRFEEGVITGIKSVSGYLERYYPKRGTDKNELPDQPTVL